MRRAVQARLETKGASAGFETVAARPPQPAKAGDLNPAEAERGGGPFPEVPEDKQVKNRLHLDLRPAEGTREQELERLLALGARQVDDQRQADGTGWVVLADPEGNEFCVLRPAHGG